MGKFTQLFQTVLDFPAHNLHVLSIFCARDNKPSLVPRAVVSHRSESAILHTPSLHPIRQSDAKAAGDTSTRGSSWNLMRFALRAKFKLAARITKRVHDGLPMVPYLIDFGAFGSQICRVRKFHSQIQFIFKYPRLKCHAV